MNFQNRRIRSLPSLFRTRWIFIFLIGCLAGCEGGSGSFADCLKEGDCTVQVDVTRYSGVIPLSPDSAFWNSPQGPKKTVIELGPQLITNPQWPNPSIKQVTLSVARTEKEMAVRLEWQDDSVDDGLDNSRLYTDQIAIMFPLHRNGEVPPIMMGTEQQVVNIWQWKAVRQVAVDALKKSRQAGPMTPVEDMNAEGFSTLTRQDHQDVMGQGLRSEAGWQVVFKRTLQTADTLDTQLIDSTPMAVAVWNGSNRETNGQKGIAGWILLKFV